MLFNSMKFQFRARNDMWPIMGDILNTKGCPDQRLSLNGHDIPLNELFVNVQCSYSVEDYIKE